MEFASSKASPTLLSPLSCPKFRSTAQESVLAWAQETGQPPLVHVSVEGKIYNLRKVWKSRSVHNSDVRSFFPITFFVPVYLRIPLFQKSEYFKNQLVELLDIIKLPQSFPGGPCAFEKNFSV